MCKRTDMPTLVQRLAVDGIFNYRKIFYGILPLSTILAHLDISVRYPLAACSAIVPSVDRIC
jgi:hypothetical protein